MAVKPWLGAIKAPSDFVKMSFDQSQAPEINIELDYMFGIRCKDRRNNLFFRNNKLLYFAAALGI